MSELQHASEVRSEIVVRLGAGQTKNKRALERRYPVRLTEAIDFYLGEVRPRLASRSAFESNAFWLSRRGRRMLSNNLSCRIRKMTLEHLGRDSGTRVGQLDEQRRQVPTVG